MLIYTVHFLNVTCFIDKIFSSSETKFESGTDKLVCWLDNKYVASIIIVSLLMLLPFYTPYIYLPLRSFPKSYEQLKTKSTLYKSLYWVTSSIMMILLSYMLFHDWNIGFISSAVVIIFCVVIF